jgi:hypothetical protein
MEVIMNILKSFVKITLCAVIITNTALQAGVGISFGFNTPRFGLSIGTRRAAVRLVQPRYVPIRVRAVPVRARAVRIAAIRGVSNPRIRINISKIFRSKKRSSVGITKKKQTQRAKR